MEHNFWQRVKIEFEHWTRRTWTFEDVGAHWDATENYDEVNDETYSYFRRFVDGLRLGDIPENSRILDFCARTGNGTEYFYQHGKIAEAVCADVSHCMGEICRQRLEEAGLERYLWVPVSDNVLPFADQSFDAVLFFETIEHFPEPARLVNEISRVLRPGGIMVLTTPNFLWEPVHALAAILEYHHSEGPHRFIPFWRLLNMVARAGFKLEAVETTVLVPGGPDFLVKIGEWIEQRTRRTLMPLLGLRRVIIGRKL